MIAVVRCGNPAKHDSHPREVDVEVACSGRSRCGERVHPEHRFTEQQRVWCPGVCDCGLGRGTHGPGDHK